jgi:hypothetical protein
LWIDLLVIYTYLKGTIDVLYNTTNEATFCLNKIFGPAIDLNKCYQAKNDNCLHLIILSLVTVLER